MNSVTFLLQVAALVFLFFATFGLFPTARVSWGWFGLALWLLSLMLGGFWLHPAHST